VYTCNLSFLPLASIGSNGIRSNSKAFAVFSPISRSTPAFFVPDSSLAATFTASPIAV